MMGAAAQLVVQKEEMPGRQRKKTNRSSVPVISAASLAVVELSVVEREGVEASSAKETNQSSLPAL